MKCEFCKGSGKVKSPEYETSLGVYQAVIPCPECQGTGIADCCNGMTADTVRDHVPHPDDRIGEFKDD